MFKKTVSIVIVSVLAISIGAVSVFANTNLPNTNNPHKYTSVTYYHYLDGNQVIRVVFDLRCFDTYLDSVENIHLPASAGYPASDGYQYNYRTSVLVYVRLQNLTDDTLLTDKASYVLSSTYNMQSYGNTSSTWNTGYDIYFDSMQYLVNCNVDSYGQYLYILPDNDHFYSTGMVLAPNEIYTMSFQFDVVSQYEVKNLIEDTEVQLNLVGAGLRDWDTFSATIIDDSVNMGESYQINKISNNVQSILDAYTSNVQGSEDLSSDITTNDEKLANIHQNEAQWYSQNSQAIESTGLSNFEFSTDQSSALTGVFSLFQRLWTALGDYTFVVTFTLMMSFATFFLRHNPVKKTSGNNYSKNYSKGGGESHGSSAG